MLTTKFIREHQEDIKKGLKKRNYDQKALNWIDEIINSDNQRKKNQTELDQHLNRVNSLSKEIGELYRKGMTKEAENKKNEVSLIKVEEIKNLEDLLRVDVANIENLLLQLPNLPHPSVPPGKGEEDNEIVKNFEGSFPDLSESKMPHWELADKYRLIDFRLGASLTGSGFPVFTGYGAKLERALIAFFLDEAEKAGYKEIIPPLMVNEQTARATGQLPDKEGQMYHVEKDNLYLIPTAEVPLTNVYFDKILDEEDLPVKLTGYTPCFRREAGSYGADVKGLNRVHQFDKVEIVHIEHPNRSYLALDEMVNYVEGLLLKLELPYRILRLCGGDLGFTSALTFDFEVFSAAQEKWLEVSSISNFETFQSNRLKLRYRENKSKKPKLLHTLNGSALALPRIVAAILENYQAPDGIQIPPVLHKYTNFDIINS